MDALATAEKKAEPNNGKITKLKAPVPLPNLPDFTGHKTFMHGSVHNTDFGQEWTQDFSVKEPAKDVLNWYNDVLRGQQWKVTAHNEIQVSAETKDGDRVVISANPDYSLNARCDLVISYFISKKQN